ncbi:unnamed protein product [Camellia sinensis]
MIREKMFRLHRHKSSTKSGERIDFNFSNIQALQVPKGWDKLYVSLLSTETGKTVSKSGKASVRNGTCRWTETLSESVWISQDEAPKEFEQYLFKLVVSMGSARSSILGEATINLAGYMSSRASIPVSLPLKKCNHGTVLQVEIQCLTPRTKSREEKQRHTNSFAEDANSDLDDLENKSEVSDCTFTRSVGSSSSNHLDGTSHPGDLASRETSFSASGSFDSTEDSLGRESFSPQSNISGVVQHVIGRQDSVGSQFCAPHGSHPVYDSPGSNNSSNSSVNSGSVRHLQNQRGNYGQISHITSPLRNAGSSINFLETEEVTIEELRAEAGMWERNARKLMLDRELLSKEFADQSKQLTNLDVELSASRTECDGLKQEIEHLKVLLDESMEKQKGIENLKIQSKDMDNIQKVLEDEIKFQKDSNDGLAMQLKKTQDSNLELVSILQEMEETIEKQKLEIENLTVLKSKFGDSGKKYSFRPEDNGEVNPSEEVSAEKMRKVSCDSDLEGSPVEHLITVSYAEFEQEDYSNLELQLQQLRESQKNLESTILHLEKTLEDKNHEIIIERDLKCRTLQDCEAEWRCKLTVKEEEIINLEAKLSKALGNRDSTVTESENRGDLNLIEEIEVLKEKVQELEKDCNELTDENLELLLKLKEAGKNLPINSASESDVRKLRYQICQLKQEIKNEEIPIERVATNHIRIQNVDLEHKCAEMELQLLSFKDEACYLNAELQKCHSKIEEQEIQIAALQRQLEYCQGEKTGSKDNPADIGTKLENSESLNAIDKFELLPALFEQLQLLLVNVKKQRYTLYSPVDTEYTYAANNSFSLYCKELTTQKGLEEAVLDNLVQLNKLFEAKIAVCEDNLPCTETVITSTNANEIQNKPEGDNLEKITLCACSEGISSSNKEVKSRVADLSKELLAKTSQIEDLNADLLLREEEIEALRHHQRDLETQISDLQKIKEQMEGNMEIMQRERSVTSECLDNLKNDLMVLSSSMESKISDNKVLERKSLELESTRCELEHHLSELEEENLCLSGRIAGLEAQLRYLTEAREASRLELQHSESHVLNLQDDIRKLENEMETQKISMKQKTEDMQNRWLEAQEECDYLKKANPKLQATAESLIEECSSLQKSNRELTKKKIELQECCTVLEVELKVSRNKFFNCLEKIEDLDAKFSAILEEIASKEKIWISELDALRQQNEEYKEKLVVKDGLFTLIYSEKAAEVENHQEVADLTGQIPEADLEEVQGNFQLSQKKIEITHMDCDRKTLDLMNELAVSKENHEILVANHEKLLGLLEDVRSNEDKLKGTINSLESKLKSAEHERLQLTEEISGLKIQLQKISPLQDEVLVLKGSLYGTKFENEKLQTSLQFLSGDYEELKTERISLLQKISSMQKATSELENCKRSKDALEEKMLRLEGDLTASQAQCTQDSELKNELGRIKRLNSQFLWKIKHVEEEKEEWLQRAQALEEELKQKKEVKQEQIESRSNHFVEDPRSCATNTSINQELKLSEKKEEGNIVQLSKDQSESCVKTENQGIALHQRHDNDEQYDNTASSPKAAIDTASRIQFLENELAEALEANDLYKAQLKSLLAEEVQIGQAINKEEEKQKADKLEAELREISERYLDMSLKYAEVEAQREQLVMKLKAANSGKKWFS